MSDKLDILLNDIRACRLCEGDLPLGPRPIIQLHSKSKILIAGQAPGKRVHESGVPWDDPSGQRLREWLGVDANIFYDAEKVALVPMGFCYPGTGKSGDLPPRKECVQTWHQNILKQMLSLELTIVIGKYAHDYYLKGQQKDNLTKTVQAWKDYAPSVIPLPHPSPRNNIWLKKNPWFEKELIPVLRKTVEQVIA